MQSDPRTDDGKNKATVGPGAMSAVARGKRRSEPESDNFENGTYIHIIHLHYKLTTLSSRGNRRPDLPGFPRHPSTRAMPRFCCL